MDGERRSFLGLCTRLFFLFVCLWASQSAASVRHLEPWSGATLPGFSLPDVNGLEHALTAQQGRVVLVHFFATWCEPCREELSSLAQLAERRKAAGVIVLAVNVAEVPVHVRRFLEGTPVNFPVLLDADKAVTRSWGVSGLPTTFILDSKFMARLFVRGDLEWTRDDILAAIDQLGTGGN